MDNSNFNSSLPSQLSVDPSARSAASIWLADPSLVNKVASVDPTDSERYMSQFPTDPSVRPAPSPDQQSTTDNSQQSGTPPPPQPIGAGSARTAAPLFSNVQNAMQQSAPPDPLAGTPLAGLGNLTTNYGDKTKDEASHQGIDIANAKGTPIPSTVPGVVAGIQKASDPKNIGYGNNVLIKDGDGNFHRYSHLTGSYVKVGQAVGAGQKIGAMGATGNAYSPTGGDASHLDYRIQSAYGQYMNPFQYFKRFRQQRV